MMTAFKVLCLRQCYVKKNSDQPNKPFPCPEQGNGSFFMNSNAIVIIFFMKGYLPKSNLSMAAFMTLPMES